MMSDKKISSIATFQVIAILAIISLRTAPFLSLYYDYDDPLFKSFFYAIKALARFAIPFLFMAAGYFWGRKINEGADVRTQSLQDIKKLAVVFFAWSVIYGVIPYWIPVKTITHSGSHYDLMALLKDRPLKVWSEFQNEPLNFLMEGTCVLLWFLTALMIAIAMLAFLISTKKQKYIIPLSVVLYLFGLLANIKTYSHTPLGIHLPVVFNTRNGPFFSMLFVSLGWWFSKQKKGLPSTRLILWMIFGGFAFQEMESFLLWKFFRVNLVSDYLLGTVPYAIGVFLLAMAHPDFGKNTLFPKIGLLTLGIYAAHPLIQPYVQYFFNGYFNPVLWQILFPLLLLVFTAVFVYLLKKVPVARNIVP